MICLTHSGRFATRCLVGTTFHPQKRSVFTEQSRDLKLYIMKPSLKYISLIEFHEVKSELPVEDPSHNNRLSAYNVIIKSSDLETNKKKYIVQGFGDYLVPCYIQTNKNDSIGKVDINVFIN